MRVGMNHGGLKVVRVVHEGSEWFMMGQSGSRQVQVVREGSGWFHEGLGWFKVCCTYFEIAQDGSERIGMD